MEKTYTAKTPPNDFKVTTPENPLLSKQAVTSKRILVSYTNIQLNPYLIPNWTCSVVIISHFQCTAPNTWLTNRCADSNTRLNHQLEKDVGYKVLQFIKTMKIKMLIRHKTLWCTNTVASSRERWTRTNSISGHNLHEQDFTSHLCNYATFNGP